MQSYILEKRKENTLNYNIVDISLQSNQRSVADIYKSFKLSTGFKFPQSIYRILNHHYQSHDITYWKEFLTEWMSMITNYVFIYIDRFSEPAAFLNRSRDVFICGVLLYIDKNIQKKDIKDIYIRLLCSKYKCGGTLLSHVVEKIKKDAKHIIISLNSEPSCVDFYIKHGFTCTSEYDEDEETHIRYPYMVLMDCNNNRIPYATIAFACIAAAVVTTVACCL